jgi:hypothetical protein
VGKTNSIVDRELGVCILAHPTEYLWRVQIFGYKVEVSEAPVKGGNADHRGGDAHDEDARFGRVTMTYGNMLSVHTTYPL